MESKYFTKNSKIIKNKMKKQLSYLNILIRLYNKKIIK